MRTNSEAPVVWMVGLSGSGKTTLCESVAKRLQACSTPVVVLDADCLRKGLCSNLGLSLDDRSENIRRIAHVAKLFSAQGVLVLVAAITPTEAMRSVARAILPEMILVSVKTSLFHCARRDVKGLYAKATNGDLQGMTGMDSPFEPPSNPQVVCDTEHDDTTVCTERILAHIKLLKQLR